jgi:hypothetical protein
VMRITVASQTAVILYDLVRLYFTHNRLFNIAFDYDVLLFDRFESRHSRH